MQIEKSEIKAVIASVVAEISKSLRDLKVDEAENLTLLGTTSSLDSLTTLNFFVLLEEQIKSSFGREVSFLEETLLSQPEGKIDTTENLSTYLYHELNYLQRS